MLDWMTLFDTRGVSYDTSGANVSRGNIAVHCPFCGSADEGKHLSISLEGRGWRCWRHPEHRGKSSARLISALLGVSLDDAKVLAGERTDLPTDIVGRLNALIGPKVRVADRALVMPPEFKPFTRQSTKGFAAKPFLRYLATAARGGYSAAEVIDASERFKLRYCNIGVYSFRIIFPVYAEQQLVGWTGRSISPNAKLRYRTLSPDADKAREEGYEAAPQPITNYLLWQDRLRKGGDLLVLTEGPFDALRVEIIGRALDLRVRATCMFTISPSEAQLDLLHEYTPRFRHRAVLLDEGTLSQSLLLMRALAGLGFRRWSLPPGVKDPGSAPRGSLGPLLIDMAGGHR